MRKFPLFLATSLVLLASCQKEKLSEPGGDGMTAVKFTAQMENSVDTRATNDGDGLAASVNRCIMEVYYDGERFLRQTSKVDANHQAVFTAQMVSNRTYTVAFWADHVADSTTDTGLEADLYYQTHAEGGLKAIQFMGTYLGNQDARDAFFYSTDDFTVNQAGSEENVTLSRPFAQVNVITTDWDVVSRVSSLKPDSVDVTISNPLTLFNAVTKEASADPDVTALHYEAALYVAPAPLSGSHVNEKTLSMDYLFASSSRQVMDVAFKARKENHTPVTHTFASVPYQRNYRTNIKGALLTTTGRYNVTVDPAWQTPDSEKTVAVAHTLSEAQHVVDTCDEPLILKVLQEAADNATAADLENVEGKKYLRLILKTSSPTRVEFVLPSAPATVGSTQVEGWLITSEANYPTENVVVSAPTGSKLKILAPSSHVEVTGTSYAEITASTGDQTLVIPEGMTVGMLILEKGGVEIHGTVQAAKVQITGSDMVYVRDCENLIQSVYEVLCPYIDVDNGYAGVQNGETWNVVAGTATPVAQIGSVPFYTLKAAFQAAQDNDLIELLADCPVYSTIPVGKSVTLALGSRTIQAACSGYLFDLNMAEAGMTFIIKGKDAENKGHIASQGTAGHQGLAVISGQAAAFELNAVSVHGATENDAYVGVVNSDEYSLISDGQANMDDVVKLTNSTIKTTSVILGGNQDGMATGTVILSGGSYEGAKGLRFMGSSYDSRIIDTSIISTSGNALYSRSNTVLSNVTVTDQAQGSHAAVTIGGPGTMTLSNVNVSSASYFALSAEHDGQMIVHSGSYGMMDSSSSDCAVIRIHSTGGHVIVNGGTFVTSVCSVWVDAPKDGVLGSTSIAELKGGEFGGNLIAQVSSGQVSKIVITGGLYSLNPSLYVAAGYQANQTASGKWEVVEKQASLVASESELTDALGKASAGDIIKLTSSITIANPLTIAKAVTINLNGETITTGSALDATDASKRPINIKANGVILQNGTIDGSSVAPGYALINVHNDCVLEDIIATTPGVPVNVRSAVNMTIKGAESKYTSTGNYSGNDLTKRCYETGVFVSSQAVVNVEDGEFKGRSFAMTIATSGGTINISGGTLNKGNVQTEAHQGGLAYSLFNDGNNSTSTQGTINISGNPIIHGSIRGRFNNQANHYTYLNIYGGTFDSDCELFNFDNGKAYLSPTCSYEKIENGKCPNYNGGTLGTRWKLIEK